VTAHTDWFFAAPRELVGGLAAELGLAVLEPPLTLPAVRVAMVWHERMHADAGHRYLREMFAGVIGGALRGERAPPRAGRVSSGPRLHLEDYPPTTPTK
jgi:hypothetical protein